MPKVWSKQQWTKYPIKALQDSVTILNTRIVNLVNETDTLEKQLRNHEKLLNNRTIWIENFERSLGFWFDMLKVLSGMFAALLVITGFAVISVRREVRRVAKEEMASIKEKLRDEVETEKKELRTIIDDFKQNNGIIGLLKRINHGKTTVNEISEILEAFDDRFNRI